MDEREPSWQPLHTIMATRQFQQLDIDCTAVGISTLGNSAIRINKILHLDGEIHEEPGTLQSQCASLIAIWTTTHSPSLIDLGKCTCVGRRVLQGNPKRGRRFGVHAAALDPTRLLFVVISSTSRWADIDRVKDLIDQLVKKAQRVFADTGIDRLLPEPRSDTDFNWYLFTSRETEILKLIANGLSNKQIARELGSSPNTVRNQIHAVFRKADVSNRTDLALRVAAAV